MKITKINIVNLRNNEHFMYHTEFKDLVIEHGAEKLKILPQFETYSVLFDKEDEGIKKINKSSITAEIQAADKARDEVWSGMLRICSGALKDFDPEVKKAGQRLKIVFDTYGKIATMPLNEQTSAIINVLQELQGKYAADVAKVGIERWVNELQARNIAFRALTKERYDETTMKTDVVVKEARAALDKAYYAITERIAAMVLLEGAAVFEPFIRSLNTIIEKFNDTLARRLGKKKAGDTTVAVEMAAE
jgi:hypothetical protein